MQAERQNEYAGSLAVVNELRGLTLDNDCGRLSAKLSMPRGSVRVL